MATPKRFIQRAIKRPGALTKRVGGPPGKHVGAVRRLAKGGGLAAKQANFYLNVLRPAAARRRGRR